MANFTDRLKEIFKALSPAKVGEYIQESQIYRSVFRVGVPDSDRKRMLVMLGRARHGHRGLAAHVSRVHDRFLQTASRVQLECRRDPSRSNSAVELYGLSVALGSTCHLGDYGGQQYGSGHAVRWTRRTGFRPYEIGGHRLRQQSE